MSTEPVFSDLDLTFERNPITNDIGRKTNNEAIKQAMKNVILTKFYERPFNSSLGSGVYQLLFEPLDPLSAAMLKKMIEQTLVNFEPRIDLQSVTVNMKEDENELQVMIEYAILGMQTLQTFNLILERTR